MCRPLSISTINSAFRVSPPCTVCLPYFQGGGCVISDGRAGRLTERLQGLITNTVTPKNVQMKAGLKGGKVIKTAEHQLKDVVEAECTSAKVFGCPEGVVPVMSALADK